MFKIFNKISAIASTCLAFFSLFLLGRNSKLSKNNKELHHEVSEQKHTIDIQKKIINVVKNTKSKPIAGNIERMRKNKL